MTWLPAMVVAVRRLISRNRFDCMVTTSPPESSHLLGLMLGNGAARLGSGFPRRVEFEPLRERFPTAIQRSLDSRLERLVTCTADAVVGAWAPIARDLEKRFEVNADHVPSGWDPRDVPSTAPRRASSKSEGVRLVHTGTLARMGRNPAVLFEALRVVNSGPASDSVRLIHAERCRQPSH